MLWTYLEQLIEYASSYSDELIDAKSEYQKTAGQAYEDDRSYESQMAMFHEWFIFDRILPETESTLLERMLEDFEETWDHKQQEVYGGFRDNIFGLFRVKKLTPNEVTVENLFDNEKHSVNESEGRLMFNKGDLFQGRLLKYEEEKYFTRNFSIHPKGAFKFIETEIKSLLREEKPDIAKWKSICSEVDSLQSDLNKCHQKTAKIKEKILKAGNPDKQIKLEVERQELECNARELDKKKALSQAKQRRFKIETFKVKFRTAHCELAHRMNYMKLKWERSRQIDIRDIYKN